MALTVGVAASKLSCQRGGRLLFEDLSFALRPGEALFVGGPNGAGKTSLLRLIAGLLPLESGSFGLEGESGEASLPELCHYVGHANALKSALSVAENLRFWGDYLSDGEALLEPSLQAFGLGPLAHLPAGLLSAGQKRKLALSRLFAAPRPIWLLDEPQVSLDAASVQRLDQMLASHLAGGGVAIVASHTPFALDFAHRLTLGEKRAK